jgi:hypothetical protein
MSKIKILKLMSVFTLSVIFAACSSAPSSNTEINDNSKPTARNIPVADILYVDLNPLNVNASLTALSDTVFARYQTQEVPAGAPEGFPVLAATQNRPYFVVQLYDSADNGLPTIGVVIRTDDLYIAGYINDMRANPVNQTFYRYARGENPILAVDGVNRTVNTNVNDRYGPEEGMNGLVNYFNIRNSIIAIAALDGGPNNGVINFQTTQLFSPLLSESIRFSNVLRAMIRVMQRVQNPTTGLPPQFRFIDEWRRFFRNWNRDTGILRDLLTTPVIDITVRERINEIRRRVHIFLRATAAVVAGTFRITPQDPPTTNPPAPPPASIFRYVIGSFESGNGKWISEVRQEIKQTRDVIGNIVLDSGVEWPLSYCIHYQGSTGDDFFQSAIGRNSGNLNLFFVGRASFGVTDSAIQDQQWHDITNLTGNHNLISQTEYRLDQAGTEDTNINGTVVSSESSCQP